jgi:predicted dehydrogenase
MNRRIALGAIAAPFTLAAGASLAARAQVSPASQDAATPPLRVGIAGLVHGHINGFIRGMLRRRDIRLVGVAEANTEVARAILSRHGASDAPLHADIGALLSAGKPEVVLAFTSTFDHAAVVTACAARGVHVMMEKPLAVSLAHGRAIAQAAARGKIQVMVNYETTWYPSNQAIWRLVKEQKALGEIRKLVAHHGHRGPKEIGVGPEFLGWLVDPKLNGGGALYDFGCYGANLATWLMDNQRPLAVTAVTQTIKPDIYSRVDDEATIVLTYPRAQAILQASWNWPLSRKDLEVYGRTGQAFAWKSDETRQRLPGKPEEPVATPPLAPPHDQPLDHLIAVVRGQIAPGPLSSLENNLIVTEILDAARTSARTRRTVELARRS